MSITNRLALVAGLLILVFSVPSRADNWYRLESANFVMYTTAKEKAARKLLNELEGFRILVLNFINVEIPPDAEKVKVMLFRGSREFRKYTWNNQIAGYAIPTETSAIIVLSANYGSIDTTNIIYHEYVHTLLQHHTGKLPGWYNEGLAELFGATQYYDGKFRVGFPPRDRLEAFYYGGKMASFDDIVSDKFRFHRIGIRYDPYVQYWLLAFYLEFGNKARKEDLNFYLSLYNDGMKSLEAFQTAFEQTPEEFWDTEVRQYFSKRKVPGLNVTIPPELLATPISRVEADMAEVEENLLTLKARVASIAFQTKDYRKRRKLFQEYLDEIDHEDRNFLGVINSYVWALATSPDDKLRDGKEAMRLGELYIKGNTDDLSYLDTLAAAYAEAGRFEEAVQVQADVVGRLELNEEGYQGFVERLKAYKNNEPWHEKDD